MQNEYLSRCKSRIHSILNGGHTYTEEADIRRSVASFFQKLFTSEMEELGEPILDYLEQILSDMDMGCLWDGPTLDEIRDAVSGINGDSVSGHDGFT